MIAQASATLGATGIFQERMRKKQRLGILSFREKDDYRLNWSEKFLSPEKTSTLPGAEDGLFPPSSELELRVRIKVNTQQKILDSGRKIIHRGDMRRSSTVTMKVRDVCFVPEGFRPSADEGLYL